jgi:hypothetical protein
MDDWKRRREREDEEDELRAKRDQGKKGAQPSTAQKPESSEQAEDLVTRAETLIEQINNLYQMFFAGVERLPPIEKRKQLEQVMQSLARAGKSSAANQFRISSIQSRFTSYLERWDKLLRDLESGKKRR